MPKILLFRCFRVIVIMVVRVVVSSIVRVRVRVSALMNRIRVSQEKTKNCVD